MNWITVKIVQNIIKGEKDVTKYWCRKTFKEKTDAIEVNSREENKK